MVAMNSIVLIIGAAIVVLGLLAAVVALILKK